MNVRRGEIVIVDYPYNDRSGGKVRPALVVQADAWNERLDNTILASITSSRNQRIEDSTLYFIDIAARRMDNKQDYALILLFNVIGSLPDAAMGEIDACLKAALGIQ